MDEHPRWRELDQLNLIRVRLLGMDASIVIEVWGSDPEPPQEPPLPLPRRKPRPSPGPRRPIATEKNPELLRRVIDGIMKLDDEPGGDDMRC